MRSPHRRRCIGPRGACGALPLLAGLALGFLDPPGLALAEASAAVGTNASADSTLGFANFLMQVNEPDRAATEYLRCLWLTGWDSSATTIAAVRSVGEARYILGNFPDVIRWWDTPQVQRMDPCLRVDVEFLAAKAALRLDRVSDARQFLSGTEALDCARDSDVSGRSHLLLGIASLYERKWEDAQREFGTVPGTSPLAATAARYRDLAPAGDRIPNKNPALAGWLAIVPGAGYAYAGFKQTALSALIVNTVFALAARQAFRTNQEVLGGFLVAFGASWYAGSIYGSVESAKRANAHYLAEYLEQFEY